MYSLSLEKSSIGWLTLYAPVIYPSVNNELMRNLFEGRADVEKSNNHFRVSVNLYPLNLMWGKGEGEGVKLA